MGAQPVTTRISLRGGMVADGIGATTQLADVLIDGPLIASIGTGGPAAPDCEVIDLPPGSVICPGFIDAHVHAEGPLLAAGRVDGALAQGVTTLVVGQDGESWIGATAATARYLNQYFAPVNGALDPARDLSVAAYRDALSGRLTQNVAVLASQGTIRHNIAGLRPARSAPASVPPPGGRWKTRSPTARWACPAALTTCRAGSAAWTRSPTWPGRWRRRAAYVSHLRGYERMCGSAWTSWRLSGAPPRPGARQSLVGGAADIAAAFEAADASGVSVSYDMYPYRRSSTILAMLLLPASLQSRGPGPTLAALTSPRQRAELLAGEKFAPSSCGMSTSAACPRTPRWPGSRLPRRRPHRAGAPADAAASASPAPATRPRPADGARTPGEWVLDLLVSTRLNVGAHLDRPGLTDAQLAWLASGDRQCGGSDGIYRASTRTRADTGRSPGWQSTT